MRPRADRDPDRTDGGSAVRAIDVAIVGGGAAGLSAALMLGRARRSVAVLDAGLPRNRVAPHLHGLLSRDGMPPLELLSRGRDEARGYGVDFLDGEVTSIERTQRGFLLRGGRDIHARRVIVATGLVDELPAVPGLRELWGTGVVMCPYCDGWEVRDQPLGVLATSPMSRNQAHLLRRWSADVTVFGPAEAGIPEAEMHSLSLRGIRLAPAALEVDGSLGDVRVRTAEGDAHVARLFVGARPRPADVLLAQLGAETRTTPMGTFTTVDANGRTSVDGVWAVGNVVDAKALVPIAIGAGVQAATEVNIDLLEEEIAQTLAAASPRREGTEMHTDMDAAASEDAVVEAAVSAMDAHDAEALAALFVEHGSVRDEGETHEGRSAIRQWFRSTPATRMEPLRTESAGASRTIEARVHGDYPQSPLKFRYDFVLDGDRIETLAISLR